jgi:hypothetical protein
MRIDQSIRIKAALVIIVIFALAANIKLLAEWIEPNLDFVGRDDITLFEKRFEPVKKRMPEHALVGYTIVGHKDGSDEDLRQRYLTQYTLAPRTIIKSTSQEYVIKIDPAAAKAGRESFTINEYEGSLVVFDYGNGISLIRNRR